MHCKSRGGMSEVIAERGRPRPGAGGSRHGPASVLRIGGPIMASLPNRLPGLDFGLGETAGMLRGQVEAFAADAIAPRVRAS